MLFLFVRNFTTSVFLVNYSTIGACPGSNETKGNSTCKVCSMSVDSIIKSHVDFCKKYGKDLATAQRSLPHFYIGYPKLTKGI